MNESSKVSILLRRSQEQGPETIWRAILVGLFSKRLACNYVYFVADNQ